MIRVTSSTRTECQVNRSGFHQGRILNLSDADVTLPQPQNSLPGVGGSGVIPGGSCAYRIRRIHGGCPVSRWSRPPVVDRKTTDVAAGGVNARQSVLNPQYKVAATSFRESGAPLSHAKPPRRHSVTARTHYPRPTAWTSGQCRSDGAGRTMVISTLSRDRRSHGPGDVRHVVPAWSAPKPEHHRHGRDSPRKTRACRCRSAGRLRAA